MKVCKRETKTPNPRVAKRLLAYAAMAGAGVAAFAPYAKAEVIYTPVHRNVGGHYGLDLNNDGIFDFAFSSYQLSSLGWVTIKPVVISNKVAAGNKDCLSGGAAALPAGVEIGPGLFRKTGTCMATSYGNGSWFGVKEHYLGLAFVVNGELHYGWARLSFNNFFCYKCIARIQGYAYETVPGKAIRAGEEGNAVQASIVPGSLGMLALGASGLKPSPKELGQE